MERLILSLKKSSVHGVPLKEIFHNAYGQDAVRSLETPTSPDDCEIPTFSRTELGGANLSNTVEYCRTASIG